MDHPLVPDDAEVVDEATRSIDGLGADTGPHREEQDGGGDEWGYYDDAGELTRPVHPQPHLEP